MKDSSTAPTELLYLDVNFTDPDSFLTKHRNIVNLFDSPFMLSVVLKGSPRCTYDSLKMLCHQQNLCSTW